MKGFVKSLAGTGPEQPGTGVAFTAGSRPSVVEQKQFDTNSSLRQGRFKTAVVEEEDKMAP